MIDAEGEELGEHLTYVTLEPGETKAVAARLEIPWLSATGVGADCTCAAS